MSSDASSMALILHACSEEQVQVVDDRSIFLCEILCWLTGTCCSLTSRKLIVAAVVRCLRLPEPPPSPRARAARPGIKQKAAHILYRALRMRLSFHSSNIINGTQKRCRAFLTVFLFSRED
jgi:hypothetical protein